MSNLRTVCRPHTVFSSIAWCCKDRTGSRLRSTVRVSMLFPNSKPRMSSSPSILSPPWFDSSEVPKDPWSRMNQRRMMVRASNWTGAKSPYETLELENSADEDTIKVAYRRLAKFYHPDVYDGKGTLEDGETAEARFIKIQAAYELLMDKEKRRNYDADNRVNPMKASQAWMEWVMKKRKAFEQRGDMAVATWAEQQQREMNLRVRRLSRSKMDPDEERKLLARERKAAIENFNSTIRRHSLVLRKRDLNRKKAKEEEEKKKFIGQLLAAEGLELESDDDEAL